MASAVDQLEALFQRAESDLSYVHRKLDTQLSAKYESIGQSQVTFSRERKRRGGGLYIRKLPLSHF